MPMFISSSTGVVSATAAYPEIIQIESLEAKDFRDLIDPQGVCDSCAHAAQWFSLTAAIKNNAKEPQPFLIIMEIRDEDGVTQYLEFQLGQLDSNAASSVAISWHPSGSGEFELRSFVISDLIQSKVLSNIHSAIVEVS
jgi:hypothetical protein